MMTYYFHLKSNYNISQGTIALIEIKNRIMNEDTMCSSQNDTDYISLQTTDQEDEIKISCSYPKQRKNSKNRVSWPSFIRVTVK